MIKLEVRYSAELDQNDAAYDHKRLIVGEQRLEHLADGGGLYLGAAGLLDAGAADRLGNHKDDSHEQCYPAEAGAFALAAQSTNQQHGKHRNERRADARTGAAHD